MIRTLIAALGTSVVLSASFAAAAGAVPGDQMISLRDGKIRCLLTTDDVPRGGGPAAVCDVVDGQFGIAPLSTGKYPKLLNLAITKRDGQMFWMAGQLPPPGNDVALSPGQTYRANGWTIRTEDLRAFILNDYSGHGMTVNPTEVRAAWP